MICHIHNIQNKYYIFDKGPFDSEKSIMEKIRKNKVEFTRRMIAITITIAVPKFRGGILQRLQYKTKCVTAARFEGFFKCSLEMCPSFPEPQGIKQIGPDK